MRTIPMLMTCAALASCGDPTPEAVGRGLPQVEVGNVVGDGDRRVDAAAITSRRFVGTWRGRTGADRVEVTFGGDGTLSMQLENDRGIVDQSAGTWRERSGLLSGSTSGSTGQLRRYGKWSAAFPGPGAMNISGSEGAILVVRR